MSVIDKIHMLKKMVKEAENIVIWQQNVYTALHNIDAGWVVSGVFPVSRGGTGLSTIAAGGILYASALDILSRIAPAASNQVLRSTAANALQFAALLVADIPNLPASKITSGQFPLNRMPRAASGLFFEGNGVGADPIFNALIAANIPNLPASKITSGRFPMTRMPDMGLNKIMVGQGTGSSPIEGDPIPKAEDESGNFTYTTAYGIAEQDVSALFTTALTGTTRRKYTVYLDLTNFEVDGNFANLYVAVKAKVDGTNYRAIDRKTIAKADIAATAEPGVVIMVPAVAQDVQITFQMSATLASNRVIYYHHVKEFLE